MVDRLGATPLVTQLPIGVESDFVGLVDLVSMQAIRWLDESLGAQFTYEDIPADLAEQAAEYRKTLVERSEEHTSELQSLMRISYAVFCLKKKKKKDT